MNDQDDTPQNTSLAVNPFGGSMSTGRSAEVERSASQSIAEVQGAMVIAQKFPRDPQKAMDAILNACTRPSLAQGALYTYARGGTDITGPSIRLAEVCAQNWGNINFGIRELEQRDGISTVEAFAWDMQTNTKQVKVFQVPHVRSKRSGNVNLSDPRDIYELVANQGARRLRACILGVIPGDVIEAAVEQCDKTLTADADISPEAIKRLLVAFEKIGVTKEQIETRIQRKMESIRPAQVVSLKKIGTSIRDGMSDPADWFPVDAVPASQVPKFKKETPPEKSPDPKAQDAPRDDEPPNDPNAPEVQQDAPQATESALQGVKEKMEEDAVRSSEVVAWLYAQKLVTSDKITLKSCPEESLVHALVHWGEIVESTTRK